MSTKKQKRESTFDKKRKFEDDSTSVVAAAETSAVTSKAIKIEPVDLIRSLEKEVLESLDNTNKIIEIIAICNKEENIQNLEIIFQTIKSLERIFIQRLDSSNDLLCQYFIEELNNLNNNNTKENTDNKKKINNNSKTATKKNSNKSDDKNVDAFKLYTKWILEIYQSYLKLLRRLIRYEDPSIQIPTLNSLFAMLTVQSKIFGQQRQKQVGENKSVPAGFYNRLAEQFVRANLLEPLIYNVHLNSKLIEHLQSRFIQYHDVQHSLMSAMTTMIQRSSVDTAGVVASHYEFKEPTFTTNKYVENIFDLLVVFEVMEEVPAEWKFLVGEPIASMIKDVKTMRKKNKEKRSDATLPTATEFTEQQDYWIKVTTISSYKQIFGKLWLAFLSLPLPNSIYKHVLLGLPDQVMPHLSNPTLLMDFFSKSYDLGGIHSILALNGLFILIHKYNLEFPDFYKKLYSLFQPGIIYAKYRSKFFNLAELFLSSNYLPNYLVAAFLKRASYLCLITPPFGSLILLPLIFTLLQRHPNCHSLINNITATAKSNTFNSKSGLLIESDRKKQVTALYGEDPYLPMEADPAKCNALKSSLWEIQLLRQHYFPEIRKLATLFDAGLKGTVSSSDFASSTYQSLFESTAKKTGSVPLEFNNFEHLITDKKDGFDALWKF
ncbi:hypothetical protein PPL_03848 [Heterostelium album PN500]|uniref:CCAAT-binding factor domain-containing protein n=1 Tax=Heterostelium pallidum (strain ATCC 26659 / Pp 5 / PN500) TaxID=670386 RepID=D3B6U0_HETP5|nr:hypothetical protein PPL_03848 [Heterostelium album PN500]EFA83060.1 hypothetical protein PPL_03848 [Heterostelium album PN500]|eukprot:XP_020435177.1 hypothetical protein PPL_03848 [Heterostelium album PN500]